MQSLEAVVPFELQGPTREARPAEAKRFMGWRDLVITPLVHLTTVALAAACLWPVRAALHTDFIASCALFYAFLVAWTVAVLSLICHLWPFRPGVYSAKRSAWACYRWTLCGYLVITNLAGFQLLNLLVPPPFRKPFYQLLGATFGPGIISISGTLTDPYMVSIAQNATIGLEAILLSHAIVTTPTDALVLGRIEIGEGAIVGARSVLMPGVTVGEHAMINAMSFVPSNTKIGPYEVWGGNPARKLGDNTPRQSRADQTFARGA